MAMSQTGYLQGLLTKAPKTGIEYNRLGKSGLKISKVVLGAMSFGHKDWRDWVLEEKEALPLLEHAWKVGINTWDTADLYSNGVSEEIIGKALTTYKIPRESVVIITKCRWAISGPGEPQMNIFAATDNNGRNVNRLGLSRKHIFDAVEASVKRLGTYIDVLLIQRQDLETPREETMKALNDVVEKGWVRYIGASSMPAWEFQALNSVAKANGWHQFIAMQNYYNLIYREEEREMMPYCKDAGIGCIPWSPLARGALARPWSQLKDENSIRAKSDVAIDHLLSSEDSFEKGIVDTVETIAKERDLPMAVIATAWCIHKGVNPTVGLNSIARIDEAVLAANTELSEEEIARLDAGYRARPVSGY